MIYLDANVIFAGVRHCVERTDQATRLFARKEIFYVSALSDYETRKALLTHGGTQQKLDLLDSLSAKKFRLNAGWETAISQALKISGQLKARLAVDSADTLHVGWALALGAETFASFDREKGPRALALCLGLNVWPDPAPKDFEQMKRLKG